MLVTTDHNYPGAWFYKFYYPALLPAFDAMVEPFKSMNMRSRNSFKLGVQDGNAHRPVNESQMVDDTIEMTISISEGHVSGQEDAKEIHDAVQTAMIRKYIGSILEKETDDKILSKALSLMNLEDESWDTEETALKFLSLCEDVSIIHGGSNKK